MDKTLTISKREFRFIPDKEGVEILEEFDRTRQQIIAQHLVEYHKMFDKAILARMSIEKLQKFIELCQEVIKEKEGNNEH